MEDYLATIRRVIEEHQAFRVHIKLIGDSVSDREALATLERASADWIPGRPEILVEKRQKLQQALSSLYDGLKNHFVFEGKALPPLFGELITRALLLEHREILSEIAEAKSMIAEAKPEGSSREELLSQESHMQQMINSTCLLVEEHATKEEAILDMVKRALEDKEQNKG